MTEEERKLRVRQAYWLLLQVPVMLGLVFLPGMQINMILVLFLLLALFGIDFGVRCFLRCDRLFSAVAFLLFTLAWIQFSLPVLVEKTSSPDVSVPVLLWIGGALLVLLHLAHFLEVGRSRRCGMLFVFLLVQDGISGVLYAAVMSLIHAAGRANGFPFGIGLALALGIPWGFLLAGTALSFGISATIRRRQSREAA
jgi:hypothetical protein